jgi:hypothetical protein
VRIEKASKGMVSPNVSVQWYKSDKGRFMDDAHWSRVALDKIPAKVWYQADIKTDQDILDCSCCGSWTYTQ